MATRAKRTAILVILGWPRMRITGEGPGEGYGAELKPTWRLRLMGGRRVRNLRTYYHKNINVNCDFNSQIVCTNLQVGWVHTCMYILN